MNQNYEDKTTNMNENNTKSENDTTTKDQITIRVYCEDTPLGKANNCDYTGRIVAATYSFDL